MFSGKLASFAIIAILASSGIQSAWGRDFRITLPKGSQLTPVQRLNREGVKEIQKHQYDKAEAMFYKAYLYDASDPFTLNNLGYISELQGNLNRAQKFYALASKQDSNAVIDISNVKQLQGKPMTYALTNLKDTPMRVNRMNVEAIGLLSQDRNFEADLMLRQALALEPGNPFTLNNLGVAEEATGDFETALKYYDAAAEAHSKEPIIVTLERSWRGRPVSEMAADSAKRLRRRMSGINTAEAHATMLTWRGVAAINRNDWPAAKQDFLQAYSSNPNNAFTLNNLGYVAEKSGDLETAQFYYSKARNAENSDVRVGLATDSAAEGKPLLAVAEGSGLKVNGEIEQYTRALRKQPGPVQLIRRGTTAAKPNASPNKPAVPAPNARPNAPNEH